MVAWTTGGYSPGRNFQLGRSSALYVRRYAKRLQRRASGPSTSPPCSSPGFLRELPRGNQAAAVAKLKGIREGLKAEIP